MEFLLLAGLAALVLLGKRADPGVAIMKTENAAVARATALGSRQLLTVAGARPGASPTVLNPGVAGPSQAPRIGGPMLPGDVNNVRNTTADMVDPVKALQLANQRAIANRYYGRALDPSAIQLLMQKFNIKAGSLISRATLTRVLNFIDGYRGGPVDDSPDPASYDGDVVLIRGYSPTPLQIADAPVLLGGYSPPPLQKAPNGDIVLYGGNNHDGGPFVGNDPIAPIATDVGFVPYGSIQSIDYVQ